MRGRPDHGRLGLGDEVPVADDVRARDPGRGENCGETTIEINANNTSFDIDEFEVLADTPFCIAFTNQEAIPHNVSILDGSEHLFEGEFVNEPGSVIYEVPGLPAGEYTFVCDAHVQAMNGTVTVGGS